MKTTFALATLALCFLSHSALATASEKPNIVLIVADDMGIETIGAYGSLEFETPHIDALAARGVLFRNAFATPICTPSRVMLLTGQHSFRNYSGFGVYPEGYASIGNLMSGAGYRTALFGKWQLKGALPSDLGFDEFLAHNMIPGAGGDRYWGGRYGNHLQESLSYSGSSDASDDALAYGPDLLLRSFKDFVSRQAGSGEAFFVYYPMILPHWPFVRTPDSDSAEADSKVLFRDMVTYADKIVGAIVAHLDSVGLLDTTLIIFTSDNGTYPGLGALMPDNIYWEGAKSAPMLPGQKVPFIGALGPGRSRESTELVDLTDVLPTLADAAGLDGEQVDREFRPDGRSLLPTMLGAVQSAPRDVLITWYPSIETRPYYSALFVTDGGHKLYRGGALYDLVEDPFERRPRYPDSAQPGPQETRARLQAAMDTWLGQSERLQATPPRPRVLASWSDDQIPLHGEVALEWDITEHLNSSAAIVPGEVTIEAVQYYGLSRIAISDLAVFSNGRLVAAAEPGQAVTELVQTSSGSGVSYPYSQKTEDNVFRLTLDSIQDAASYSLRAVLRREPMPLMKGLNSQTNGYFYLHSAMDQHQ